VGAQSLNLERAGKLIASFSLPQAAACCLIVPIRGIGMLDNSRATPDGVHLQSWLPDAARNYLVHTEQGHSIRQLARGAGCHASTILRQVRKTEQRRDDPLIDEALNRLSSVIPSPRHSSAENVKDCPEMNAQVRPAIATTDEETIEREARRVLRRLCEPGACLAVAKDMEKAVVVREAADGATTRTAVVDRAVAQAMALKDWISCKDPGRITRYRITQAGRGALKRLLVQDDATRAGFAEAQTPFGDQHRDMSEKSIPVPGTSQTRRVRYNMSESPVSGLARRKNKDGSPFLSPDLVAAAERLREDFELAQMGPRVAQNWDRFLTFGDRSAFGGASGMRDGATGARDRVAAALKDLGPGLGDVVLRVACYLEGMEAAEKRMGWSARSGKIVLRIALQRLKRHYDENGQGGMIG